MTKNTGGSPINPMKPRSGTVTDGLERAPARGMLRAVGMGDEDWAKPQIGIASSWNEITPCNLSLDRLAKASKEGVHQAGGFPLQFGTISVSDGISMGHEGMHFSLVSREIIADSVETVMQAERLDGMVLFAGCDKSLPGMMMAAARLDVAAVFVYAGSTLPGNVDGKDVTIIDAFEAVGACARGLITQDQVDRIERAICPGEGACGGMYTANTMASIGEAIGLSLPGSAAPPAVDRRRDDFAKKSGAAVVELIRQGITARDILTKRAFENAITILMALGGSTNAVLHLMALAHEAEVDLELEDFHRIGAKVPLLGDLKPFGRYVMSDVDKVGGVPVVLRALLDANLLHGDTMTVSGKTMAENLAHIAPPDPDGDILRATKQPLDTTGGITILRGSLAPEGAVTKTAGIGSFNSGGVTILTVDSPTQFTVTGPVGAGTATGRGAAPGDRRHRGRGHHHHRPKRPDPAVQRGRRPHLLLEGSGQAHRGDAGPHREPSWFSWLRSPSGVGAGTATAGATGGNAGVVSVTATLTVPVVSSVARNW